MNLGYFHIEQNVISLNKYKLVIRDYKTLDKDKYTDNVYYVNEENANEWEVNIIPKHQLLELISKEELDTSKYEWMNGLTLTTDNHEKELIKIASYGSLDSYEASLEENISYMILDADYRISKLELGL